MRTTITTTAIVCALATAASATAAAELTTNGGFETGDTSGWEYFPTPSSTFTADGDAFSGAFAGRLENVTDGTAAVIKQANIGLGVVTPGIQVDISFWAKGANEIGGVNFAELFSEIDGGGVSKTEILGGAPLFVTGDWTFYSFTTTAGPDVSGGITLQLTATTGANIGSTSLLQVDDVSVTAVPAPGAAAVLGLAGIAGLRRRRNG